MLVNLFKRMVVALGLIVSVYSHAHYEGVYTSNCVVVYDPLSSLREELFPIFDQCGVPAIEVDYIDCDSLSLHIITEVDLLDIDELPEHYIIYQNKSLSEKEPSGDFYAKLKGAVAVWDTSWDNINRYKGKVPHYYFLGTDYEFLDPVVLSCFLPVKTLAIYKAILSRSNAENSRVSSHLPILFAHAALTNPKLMLEIGVEKGELTRVLRRVKVEFDSKLIGLDIDPKYASSYQDYLDPTMPFYHMDDRQFPECAEVDSNLPSHGYDVIVIDTSHRFQHTLQELSIFVPRLAPKGVLCLFATNLAPLPGFGASCINGDVCRDGGWDNGLGTARALKEYFDLDFYVNHYHEQLVMKNGIEFKVVHYPFCNGLTIIKRVW